jgi:hypothetical protein
MPSPVSRVSTSVRVSQPSVFQCSRAGQADRGAAAVPRSVFRGTVEELAKHRLGGTVAAIVVESALASSAPRRHSRCRQAYNCPGKCRACQPPSRRRHTRLHAFGHDLALLLGCATTALAAGAQLGAQAPRARTISPALCSIGHGRNRPPRYMSVPFAASESRPKHGQI